jgi:hypothetical protein
MMYVGIYDDFKMWDFVWHGLGAVARLFPVHDERTGRNERGSVRDHFPFDLTVPHRQMGAQPGKTLSPPFSNYVFVFIPV